MMAVLTDGDGTRGRDGEREREREREREMINHRGFWGFPITPDAHIYTHTGLVLSFWSYIGYLLLPHKHTSILGMCTVFLHIHITSYNIIKHIFIYCTWLVKICFKILAGHAISSAEEMCSNDAETRPVERSWAWSWTAFTVAVRIYKMLHRCIPAWWFGCHF